MIYENNDVILVLAYFLFFTLFIVLFKHKFIKKSSVFSLVKYHKQRILDSMKIVGIKARQILDSRGNPTVEADITLEDGSIGRAAVPSGASTGSNEAVELRDNSDKYSGKSVLTAVKNVETELFDAIKAIDAYDQEAIDTAMIDRDGTENKSRLGANSILAVSLATAHAAALSKKKPLYRYVAEIANTTPSLPLPMMNVMNGGQHAAGSSDIQEYMIIPIGANTIADAIEMGANIFHSLKKILGRAGYSTAVGDEGGYAPHVTGGNREPLTHIVHAISHAGYIPGKDVVLGLDVAASEFYTDNHQYHLKTEEKTLNSSEMISWLKELRYEFPILSIEDGLDENDWVNWSTLTKNLSQAQIVGDDLLVTNTHLLERGIKEQAANAILIKPNQIGTLTETMHAVNMAKTAGWNTIMSHRSGETEDTTIAHLAVGLDTQQIKTGSLSRTDRIAKYNELLRIAEADDSLTLAHPLKESI